MNCWVGFSFHDSFVSRVMADKMGRGYSHTFMLFECNSELVVLHATGRGVNAMSWQRFKNANKIVKMIKIENAEKAKNAFTYCIDRLGQPYGFLAVLAIGLGMHYEDGEKTLICSEYVARALGLKFDLISDLVTPEDVEGAL